MPDDRSPSPGSPASWGEVFAALPLETPDAGGWQRIERARRQPKRTRWPAWAAAIAAALAIIALLPLQLSRQERALDSRPVAQSDQTPASMARSQSPDAIAGEATTPTTSGGTAIASDPARTSAAQGPHRSNAIARTNAAAPSGVDTTAAARAPDGEETSSPTLTTAASATPAPATGELERLYAESAQLEALLALARDDRVSSGTAAALASDFDAQVASIDEALVQPGITRDRRIQLWRERVDALRQVTAFESTQRLLAAQGERYDARLVSID